MELELLGKIRESRGKNAMHRVRKEGFIPAILAQNKKNTAITINPKDVSKILASKTKNNTVFQLKVENDNVWAIIKDVQHHPVSRKILHVDLLEIALDKEIIIDIPLHTKGIAAGIKEGAILNFLVRKIKIACLPAKIPTEILIDVSNLLLGQTLLAKDLIVEQGIKVVTSPEKIILSLIIPKKEEEKVAEVAPIAGALAPAVAGAPAAGAAPEVKAKETKSAK